MHEQGLAGLQAAAFEDIGPNREESLRDRRRLDGGHAGGNRQGIGFVNAAEFGVAAARDKGADLLPQPVKARFRPRCYDLAGNLKPGNVGRAGRWRVGALPLQDVRAIDAGGGDLDQDLGLARQRHRPGLRHQHLRPAGGRNGDRGHRRGQVGLHRMVLALPDRQGNWKSPCFRE